MGTSALKQGTRVQINDATYVLLRKFEDESWQLEDIRSKRIVEFSSNQLHSHYIHGDLKFVSDSDNAFNRNLSGLKQKTISALSTEQLDAAKIRRIYALAIQNLPSSEGPIKAAVKEVWDKLKIPEAPPHWSTVFRWKTRLLNAGNDFHALTENRHTQGNRKSRYPDEVINLVEQAIHNVYLTLERQTIQDTLERAVTLVMAENKLRPDSMQLPWPTRRLVKRMIDAIPAFDRYAARHGRTAATKRFRAVLAHRTTQAPLERAEIDHTPLDLMVIDDDSGLPLGRPYLTVCIDDYTRCILGLYISFEPPSHFTVSRCLKMAFLPKTELLKQYPAIQNVWDAHGVMRDLVVDNGQEFHSASLENVCYSLGIEIHYSARKTPWFKGKIERFQGTLNRAIAHGTPGTTFSNIFDKEEYDPSKQAILRYSTLKEIVYTWVADVYHQKVHRTIGAPPSVFWARSISPEDILVPDNPGQLDFMLGRSEQRILTHKGIELYGLNYNSPELTILRRKLGDTLGVEIRVDTADLGHIVVLSPDKSQTFKVPALRFDYTNGLSEWQHRVCKRFVAREMNAFSPTAWLEAKARIRELVDAEFMHKKQKSRTKIARFKNMDAAPEQERPVVEAPPAMLPPPEPVNVTPAPAAVLPAPHPLTAAELSTDHPTQRVRRIKPLFRDRSPAALAEERMDILEVTTVRLNSE